MAIKKTEVMSLSIDEVLPPAQEVRSICGEENLTELAQSIKKYGVIQPITVIKKGEQYEIVAGHRRFMASKLAEKNFIPAIVIEADRQDTDMIKLHENYFRESVNPYDEAIYFKYLRKTYKLTLQEIADKVGKSGSWVSMRLKILEYDADIQESLKAELINVGIADELQQIDDPDTRYYYLKMAIENGITIVTARSWRQGYQTEKATKEAMKRRQEAIDRGEMSVTDIENSGDLPPVPISDIKELTMFCPGCFTQVLYRNVRELRLCVNCKDAVVRAFEIEHKRPLPEGALDDRPPESNRRNNPGPDGSQPNAEGKPPEGS